MIQLRYTWILLTLLVLGDVLALAQAGNTATITAEVTRTLWLDVQTSSMDWALDPTAGSYSKTLDKDHGVSLKANENGWTLFVRAESSTLTDWDGSHYGTKSLKSPITLTSYPDTGVGTGHTIELSVSNQELVTNGIKGKTKKVGLGFVQPVSWEDEPLPTGHTYHTVLTYVATI
ncbi:Uncharacterised protein [uncultured archaeon]|nr:Uncharacterised protein [uncultured archaeon]